MVSKLVNMIPSLIELVKKVGQEIFLIHQSGQYVVQFKPDKTPLTTADVVSHKQLCKGLSKLLDYPILSEETETIEFKERKKWTYYWLIDPLDGTKEFLAGTGEYSISLAFIHKNQPIFGMIYAPVTQECVYAIRGQGAYQQSLNNKKKSALKTRPLNLENLTITMSRLSDISSIPYLNKKRYTLLKKGSALKFTLLAAGQADFYVRFGKSYEWDTAAGQCILEEAGGKLVNFNQRALKYNAKRTLCNPPFIGQADSSYDSSIIFGRAYAKTR